MDKKMIDELMAEGYNFNKDPKHYKPKSKRVFGGNPANEDYIPKTVIVENTVRTVKKGRRT